MTPDQPSDLCSIPFEILSHIFTFLSPKDLCKSRVVCSIWKQTVDSLSKRKALWRQYCQKYYSDIYDLAHLKSNPKLSWYRVYRSLALWRKLPHARDTKKEIVLSTNPQDEIVDFQVLRNGILGVLTKQSVIYYDLNTLKRLQRGEIKGNYCRYKESDNVILLHDYDLNLSVYEKVNTKCKLYYRTIEIFRKVKNFLLMENDIYFVTWEDDLYLCRNINRKYITTLLVHVRHGVMSLGYQNGFLYILSSYFSIYILVDKKLRIVRNELNENMFQKLRKYNFLEQLEWRMFYHWTTFINYTEPLAQLYNITKIRTYGQVVFIGTRRGGLRIYYTTYTDDIFDITKSVPLKKYKSLTRRAAIKRLLSPMCPVIQIDVVEGEDNHTVIVAMPKKIVIVNLNHTSQSDKLQLGNEAKKVVSKEKES